jgi:hypothetical protein
MSWVQGLLFWCLVHLAATAALILAMAGLVKGRFYFLPGISWRARDARLVNVLVMVPLCMVWYVASKIVMHP